MLRSKDILLIATLLFVALTVGLLIGELGWTLFLALLIWVVYNGQEFKKAFVWSGNLMRRPDNDSDAWFALTYRPYRGLQRQRARTRDIAQRLRQILGLVDIVPDGFIVLSEAGEIEGMNTAAQQLLGLREKDRGIGLSTVVRSPDFIDFLKREETDPPLEFASPVSADATLEARRFDTETGGSVILVRDITPLNRLLTVRQQFIANVSHELRTPLTVLQGYVEVLDDPDHEPSRDVVKKLSPPLARMQNLINDLLLLTQLESNSISLAPVPISMHQIVREVIDELSPAEAERVELIDAAGDAATILGNPQELHSVAMNLIQNALRYSPDGDPIKVAVTSDNNNVRLAVTDFGVGIAPEHIDRLTERFYRVDLADARTRGGTGLGLAIVKHILRRHGSVLAIKSELGVGSTFSCAFEAHSPVNETNEVLK